MEMISRISKGTKMDQIYIPKNRTGLIIGRYVLIRGIGEIEKSDYEKGRAKPYFYNTGEIEKIKISIIEEIFSIINKNENVKNAIISGSFLEPGFNFNDIDIIVLKKEETNINSESIIQDIKNELGIKAHTLVLDYNSLSKGISTDPLYLMMLSRFVSEKRIIIKEKREIIPQILDLHLLKSKSLIDNFDLLNGKEKYYLTKNLFAILLFAEGKKVSEKEVNRKIEELFDVKIENLKDNLIEKSSFIKEYKEIYDKTQKEIDKNVKQKPIN